MFKSMTFAVVCLLAGLTTSSAGCQTAVVTVNRILNFNTVSPPLGSVTVSGAQGADTRQAWLTIVASTKANCNATFTITTPASITRTTLPASTVPESPINATLVFPNGTTTQSIATNGSAVAITPALFKTGTYQLYIGTTGNFTAARAGSYTGSITVQISLGNKC